MSEEQSFEKAFDRLEEILQKMNEGKISLDTSLKLFEEANSLITKCNDRLVKAEQKIEILIKNRAEIETENGKIKLQNFEVENTRSMEL